MKSSCLVLFWTFTLAAAAQQVQPMVQPRPVESSAPAPAIAAVPTQVVVPNAAGYRIGAEDALMITVWKEPTLSGPLTVRPDGMISLALIGDVAAATKTPEELSAALQERLKKYIQDPLVTVVVTAALSQKVYLLGEVTHVGQVPLTPNLSILQAISASGGLTPYANPGKMYILRTVDGKQTKINVDYRKALKGEGAPLPPLMAGDTIVVK
jgi:polysaccharide export outer membrane protein